METEKSTKELSKKVIEDVTEALKPVIDRCADHVDDDGEHVGIILLADAMAQRAAALLTIALKDTDRRTRDIVSAVISITSEATRVQLEQILHINIEKTTDVKEVMGWGADTAENDKAVH